MNRIFTVIILSGLIFTACSQEEEIQKMNFSYNFSDGRDGFEAAFADYPMEDPERIDSSFLWTTLPESIAGNPRGLMLSGTNISDDLFMFVYRKIDRLQKNIT